MPSLEEEIILSEENSSQEKLASQRRSVDFTILSGIIAALIGGAGVVVGNWIQANNQLNVEEKKTQREFELAERKHQASLLDKAINTSTDPETAKRWIQFYLDTGLLSDPENKLAKAIQDPKNIPVISKWICYHQDNKVGNIDIWWGHERKDAEWACNNWISTCGNGGGCTASKISK
jgi:hypothetical protein